MAKLVAFYSRADENYFGGTKKYISEGNTKKAAEKIAELTGADLFEIVQEVPYAADYDTCIAEAKRDLKAKARPKVKNLPESLDAYEGSGLSGTVADIEKAAAGAAVTQGLAIHGSEVDHAGAMIERCRTDFADIQNKKECGGNRQWQNHYLRNWAANTKGKGII